MFTQVHLCRKKVASRSCHFYNNVEGEKARGGASCPRRARCRGSGVWAPLRAGLSGLLGCWLLPLSAPLWAVEVPALCLLTTGIGVRAEELTRWGRGRA